MWRSLIVAESGIGSIEDINNLRQYGILWDFS